MASGGLKEKVTVLVTVKNDDEGHTLQGSLKGSKR